MTKAKWVLVIAVLVGLGAPVALTGSAFLIGTVIGLAQNSRGPKTVEVVHYREVPRASASAAPSARARD